MSARLTVVLDDERLYRDLKVHAAERGVPMKQLVEDALRSFLASKSERKPKLTLEMWNEWQEQSRRMDADLPPDTPTDLSDIKHHLYGWPKQSERRREVAEDRAGYDA